MAVLLSLIEQIVLNSGAPQPSLSSQAHRGASSPPLSRAQTRESKGTKAALDAAPDADTSNHDDTQDIAENKRRLIRKMRLQVFTGAGVGLLIALAM